MIVCPKDMPGGVFVGIIKRFMRQYDSKFKIIDTKRPQTFVNFLAAGERTIPGIRWGRYQSDPRFGVTVTILENGARDTQAETAIALVEGWEITT